ncbi:MAG: TIGR01212 family radical SAM protein, partial [Candidatus Omnitrophica bacterium]|nr:TIGR01212 family radical SAM protein [Candidatus Omnitrophota bacterium]
FNYNERVDSIPIRKQIESGIESAREKLKAQKFIAYFQTFSNTYATPEKLKTIYDTIDDFDDIVMLNIGTRPDCIDEQIIELIDSYTKKREVWLELGLQSANDTTLKLINRQHNAEDFMKAVKLIQKHSKIKICAHVILGLPFEQEQDIINTAKFLQNSGIDGVKIHPIHVVKDTELEKMFKSGKFSPINIDTYVKWTCLIIAHLSKKTVVHRITADCPEELLIAPDWTNKKHEILRGVDDFRMDQLK